MNGDSGPQKHDVGANSWTGSNGSRQRMQRRRMLFRATLLAVLALILLFVAGLGLFIYKIDQDTSPITQGADGIIVLTGGAARLSEALKLLKDGEATRLLISGVNISTSRETLRQQLDADAELFDCCVDLGREAINTEGNATEAAAWVRSHNFSRIILVTSNYHMPRSLIEFRRYLPNVTVHAYPIAAGSPTTGGVMNMVTDPHALRLLLLEYSKYLVAVARSVAWDSWRTVGLPATETDNS